MTLPSPIITKHTIDYQGRGSGTMESSSSALSTTVVDPIKNISDGSTFEEIMKERNRIRKEREEYNLAELKVQIARLEDALAAETKRRVDATTTLDEQARTLVFEMEDRLRRQLQEDNKKLHERVSNLEARLEEVEQRWNKESTTQMDAIMDKASDFGKALEQFQQEQDTERKARLKREGSLLQQVENHGREFEERWAAERQDRMQQIAKLEEKFMKGENKRLQDQACFHRKLQEELEALRNDLNQEIQERLNQDEEIVAALNRYTQQLQHSLSILSSD